MENKTKNWTFGTKVECVNPKLFHYGTVGKILSRGKVDEIGQSWHVVFGNSPPDIYYSDDLTEE